ncbi:hypothetical protein DVA67_015920 [Solirubrobacter sp. CPCC 204708]|uniref:DUF4333 domain-containing protein n=1 Tax=Solirubrobacter deserti TaxID=2282478 RepID=A0ABT4RNQ8_9ACTN|nr:hypothetical protein [Solirubrobacter deserti]MBE2317471.1 hypothetical protein [Solirubrobacter deserti]MDA0140053.1 hypothetical protein [Solirubrobacter deserti]
MKLIALPVIALCAVALVGCGEDAAEIRDNVDQAREGARDAERLRDAVRDFDVAGAEQRVREAIGDGQPVRDVSCPVRPRINWDLAAVEINCIADLDSGEQLSVPVRYVPGEGFSTGRVQPTN